MSNLLWTTQQLFPPTDIDHNVRDSSSGPYEDGVMIIWRSRWMYLFSGACWSLLNTIGAQPEIISCDLPSWMKYWKEDISMVFRVFQMVRLTQIMICTLLQRRESNNYYRQDCFWGQKATEFSSVHSHIRGIMNFRISESILLFNRLYVHFYRVVS